MDNEQLLSELIHRISTLENLVHELIDWLNDESPEDIKARHEFELEEHSKLDKLLKLAELLNAPNPAMRKALLNYQALKGDRQC